MSNNDIIPGFDDEKDDSLKIKIRYIEDVARCLMLSLTGYIDTYNSAFFQKRVQKAIEAGFNRLVFNCGGLNYVSSTGIGSFTTFLKTVKPQGGDIVMLEVQPKVYEVFQLLGFSQFFNVKENLDEAINHFFTDHVEVQVSVFPVVVSCPLCGKKLKAVKSGRFRCSECKSVLAIDKTGHVTIG
jgi:anti-anti-sigma factor